MEKGGRRDAVVGAGVHDGALVRCAAEVRRVLHGRTRRVLAPKGLKVVQRVQVEYAGRSLLLAVAPLSGEIRWAWIARMRQADLRPVLHEWQLPCVVWDSAPATKANS